MARLIEAISDWLDALHGQVPLQDAFARLVRGFGADAGMLVRTYLHEFRPIRVVVHDAREHVAGSPIRSSFADSCFGPSLAKPKSATVWLASLHGDSGADPALADLQAIRRNREFAVLVLSGGPMTRDHIELHFRNLLPPAFQAIVSAVLPTMARAWAARRVGLITNMTSHQRRIGHCPTLCDSQPVLSTANPHRLSRAEFRVCLLLSRGLSAVGVAEELSLSEATVRSHLRSIYAKTGTASLAELVFLLLGPIRTPSDGLNRCA